MFHRAGWLGLVRAGWGAGAEAGGTTVTSGREPVPDNVNGPATGSVHHIELWAPDLVRACADWGWLLSELGYVPFQDWPDGRSRRLGDNYLVVYLVVEQSPALSARDHDRLRPGLNHPAFHAGSRRDVDALAEAGTAHGWTLLFREAHPHAGGPDHYAAYLTNTEGFEVELVTDLER